MAHKRLTPQQIELMKAMVQQGTAPEDISKHFEIAISSVHNYKKLFKQQGLKFPDVRGKRPTGSVAVRVASNDKYTPSRDPSFNQKPVAVSKPMEDGLAITVNGVSIHVRGSIKNINIGTNSIEVQF